MTDKLRFRIAAGLTALFLAAISAAGLAVRHETGRAGAATPPAAQPAGSVPSVVPSRSDTEAYEHEGSDEEGGEDD